MWTVEQHVDLPEGILMTARLKEIEVKTIPYNDKKTGEAKSFDKLNWLFEITEQGDHTMRVVRKETSAEFKTSEYNEPYQIAKALLGRDIPAGTAVSPGDLQGLSGLITIKYEADRGGSDGKKWARVDQVYPLDPASGFSEPPF